MEFKFVKETLDKIGDIYIQELTDKLLSLNKSASGDLIDSLDYDVKSTAEGFILELQALEYLRYVDSGRRPGKQPPTKPIEKWIKDKGIKGRDKKGRFIKDKSTAFLIARSIGKKGIKPTHVLEDTVKDILNDNRDLVFAFQNDVDAILQSMLEGFKKSTK